MIIQFRTDRNINGNCKYLALDTGAEQYATESYSWIDKDYPVLKVKEYRELIAKCERNGWHRVERI